MTIFDYVKKFIIKFNFKLRANDPDILNKLDFAVNVLIMEEVNELVEALDKKDSEEFVDALGDISWLCIKLMYQVDVNPYQVFRQIGEANLSKVRGIKTTRDNSKGFDVIKPNGWIGPDHNNNHGMLDEIFKK